MGGGGVIRVGDEGKEKEKLQMQWTTVHCEDLA